MAKTPSKAAVKRPRFNIDELPAASDTLDMRKQTAYVLARKKATLESKKVDLAKLRQVIINR